MVDIVLNPNLIKEKAQELNKDIPKIENTQPIKNKSVSQQYKQETNKQKLKIDRVPTGIFGLDELIEGGFERGSNILVVGAPGTGKTTFGLQFLYYGATKYNEPGVFITFDESKQSLERHHISFGWDFEKLEKEDKFRVIEYKPHQVNKLLQEGGGVIRDMIRTIGAKRLVMDSITAYTLLFKDKYQQRESVVELFDMLKRWETTNIITAEGTAKTDMEFDGGDIAFLTDAIISLRYSKVGSGFVREHTMEILKMRATKHSNRVCAMMFEEKGIKIYSDVFVED